MKLNNNKEKFMEWYYGNYNNFKKSEDGIVTFPSLDAFTIDEVINAIFELKDIISSKKVFSSYLELKKYQEYVPVVLFWALDSFKSIEQMSKMLDRFNSRENERSNKRWTKEEDEELIERICNEEYDLNQIAITLGRSQNAIQTRLSYLVGVKRLSQKVAGKFIGEINGKQTEADVTGTVYKER